MIIIDHDRQEQRHPISASGGAEEMWRAIAGAIVKSQEAPYTPEMASKDVCIPDAIVRALALNQKQTIASSL